MFYNIYIIIIINFLFSFDYPNSQKSIQNLKDKSEILITNKQFDLALDIYLKILDFEKNIYSEDSMQLASTYEKIADLYINLDNHSQALPYLKKSVNIYESNILDPKDKLLVSLEKISQVYAHEFKYDLLDKSEELIKSIKKIDNPYSINSIFEDVNRLNQTEEDPAFYFIELAESYKKRGLYSQAAEYFSKSLDLKDSKLEFEYYKNLVYQDTSYRDEMINAFEFVAKSDTSLFGSYFYLSLLNKENKNQEKYIEYMDQYIHYSNKNEKSQYLIASQYFDNQQYIESLFEFQKILISNKASLFARFMIARCLFELGSFDDAIKAFKIVLYNDSYDVKSRYYLGQSYHNIGEYNKAIKEFTQVLLLSPNYRDVYYYLGYCYLMTDNQNKAKESLNRVIINNPHNGDAYYLLGLIYENILDNDRAIDSYRKAIKFKTSHFEPHKNLGLILYGKEEYRDAMEYLRNYVVYNPDSTRILNILGDIFIKEDRFQEVIDTYRRLLKFEDNIHYYKYIADAYFNIKDYDNSKSVYSKICQMDSLDMTPYVRLGDIALRENNPNQAINLFLYAIKNNYNAVDMLYSLSIAYAESNLFLQSAITLQHILSISPDSPEINYQLAAIYKEMNLFTLAISHFNKYLYFYGDDPIAFYLLGESYFKINDYQNSKLAFEKSHKLNSADSRTLFYLGLVSQKLNDYSNAAKSYKKAIKLNDEDIQSHYNLAIIYLELDKKREARKKLDILYMLDKALYDSLYVRINSF